MYTCRMKISAFQRASGCLISIHIPISYVVYMMRNALPVSSSSFENLLRQYGTALVSKYV